MRLARVSTPMGVRQAEVGADGITLAPPPRSLPGLADPPLVEPASLGAGWTLLAPVLPGKIVCVGRNYVAHAAELGHEVPARPLIFHKPASSVVGPGEAILLPPDSAQVEHEAELGVVIGRRCRHVLPEDAARVIAGYTCVNDVTARDLQRADGQFARAKGFDTFCPVGPWLETELPRGSLRVRCSVGDELRQDGLTGDMVFDVATLVAAVSRVMTLFPGDLIATGTPSGVGLLRDGDVVCVEIQGIGALRNPVRRDPEVPSLGPPVGAG